MVVNRFGNLAYKALAAALGLFISLTSWAVTITFDEVQLAPGGSSSWSQLDDYLTTFGITIWMWDEKGVPKIQNVNHSSLQWMSAASSPNVLVGSSGDPDGYAAFELEFARPVNNLSFVRIGNVAAYSPSGTVKGPWTARAYASDYSVLAEVSEDMIQTYGDVPNKTFTLSASGIKSVIIWGNSYGWAGSHVPVIDNITYTTPTGVCSGVTYDDLFRFAQANYPGLFSGTPVSGLYGGYDYRYYPGSDTYLAIDSSCMIYIMGPSTNWQIAAVANVSVYAPAVSAWTASVGGGTSGGGTTGGTTGGGTTGGTTGGGTTGGGAATPACTYSIYPATLSFGPEGGTGTVNVTQNETACLVANPPWAITTNSGWIVNLRLGSLSNGVGPGYFYVQANTTTATRNATVVVAGNNVAVTQSGLNPLQGTYNGTWSGSCTLFGSVSGHFTMNINAEGTVSGTYSGADSGGFSGSVDPNGSLSTASGVAAGGAYWTGQIVAGGWGSGGGWSLPGCSGSWSIP